MSPTSSSRLLAGRKARSATLRTNPLPLVAARPGGSLPSAGVKVMPRHQHSIKPEHALTRSPKFHRRGTLRAGGMFARAVSAPRRSRCCRALVALSAAAAASRQDANEPQGGYRLEVVDASFPAKQSIAEPPRCASACATRRQARVPERRRDGRDRATRPARVYGLRPEARTTRGWPTPTGRSDPRRGARRGRPPRTRTPGSSGRCNRGKSKTFEWKVTAVKPGDYSLAYRSPGTRRQGSRSPRLHQRHLHRLVADKPVPARVDDKGKACVAKKPGRARSRRSRERQRGRTST